MCEEGYINDYGKLETSGGRHPSLYGLNADSGYFVGVEVRQFSINLGLINFKGDVVQLKMNVPFKAKNTPESLDELCKLIKHFLQKVSVEKDKILNINVNLFKSGKPMIPFSNVMIFSSSISISPNTLVFNFICYLRLNVIQQSLLDRF